MLFRQVLCLSALVLLTTAVTGCGGPPDMRHPELQHEGKAFRPLTVVPERPQVRVPLNDRAQLEEELRDNNAAARAVRLEYGYHDLEIPPDPPEPPMELPDEQQQ